MIKPDHPLCKAKWLWPIVYGTPRNAYAQFRYDVAILDVPTKAPFYITADQCYMLYVNGHYACRGPARGYQESWPYDEVDVAPYLRKGHNWISVRVYNAGVSTFQYLHQSVGGMLCAAEWGKMKVYSGPDWLERVEPGYHRETAKYSYQLNYQEWVDARRNDQSWITSAATPQGDGWAGPRNCKPFGVMPWHSLEERGVPNLTNEFLAYERVAYTSSGSCAKQWREAENLFTPIYAELKKHTNWAPTKAGRKTKTGLIVDLPKTGAGRYASVSIDMGKPCIGSLVVEARDAAGGETIDFFFTEGLFEDGRPIVGPEFSSACEAAMVNRIELKPGKTRYEFFQMLGHRYVVVIARETKRSTKLKVALRQTLYPFDMAGSFDTDNQTISDIYRICMQTQRVCSLDAYVDTPWREQAQWWGDARVQAQNTFHISGDTRLLKRGIRSIARQEVPNGLTFGHAPTMAYGCILPDFSIIWVLTLWDYYFQTGDIELFVEQRPRIERLMQYFQGEGRGSTGLLQYDKRYWLFLDWSDIHKDGYPALYNLWYLYMLEKLIELSGLAGMKKQKQDFAARYREQKRLVLQYFWDSKTGLFCDGCDVKGKAVKRYSVHTQTLAIICSLQKPSHSNMVRKRLLPYLKDEAIDTALPSSYWVTYVYEVMTKLGFGRDVLEHIARHWSPMIPSGGTWETFQHDKPYPEGNGFGFGVTSMTHAWAAHPIYHFARTLGGITQTDVAWKRLRFAPLLGALNTNQLRVDVPTPQGMVASEWRRLGATSFEVRLRLPRGVEAEVVLPGIAETRAGGKKKWLVKGRGNDDD